MNDMLDGLDSKSANKVSSGSAQQNPAASREKFI